MSDVEPVMSAPQRIAWIVYGVERAEVWTSEERSFPFEGKEILYRPETETEFADLSLSYAYGEDIVSYVNTIRRFLSLLSWLYDAPIRITGGAGGSGRGRVSKPKLLAKVIGREPEILPSIDDRKQLLALAIYRNALNTSYSPFSFSEFFRIVEIGISGRGRRGWIKSALSQLPSRGEFKDISALERLRELREDPEAKSDIASYLLDRGRHAAVHGSHDPVINPDDLRDTVRLAKDLPLMKYLAELCIEDELKVKCRDEVVWKASRDWHSAMDEIFSSKR